MKNIGLGLLTYHDTFTRFPCGGWGYRWVGVPDRGVGPSQPGGWIYCTLPFLEERNLHDLGSGLSGAAAVEPYSQRLQTALSLFVCPSRRACLAWPIADEYAYMRSPRPYGDVRIVARADYAINGGTSFIINLGGPTDLQQGNDPQYWANAPNPQQFSGVSHLRIGVSLKSITDGSSKTYLIGEKHVPVDNYTSGISPGDNESMYSGYCTDLHRFAGDIENLVVGRSPFVIPLNDNETPNDNIPDYVGWKRHAAGLNTAYCDGSVHFVGYDIDPEVHFRSGHRSDNGRPLESLH